MTQHRSDDAKTVPVGKGRYLEAALEADSTVTRIAGVPERGEALAGRGVLDIGDVVDNFVVVRLLGRGGMGEVYLARDVKLGRKVALKLIQPGYLRAAGAAERFMTEARLTARFDHPHIIPVHGVGEYRGQPYLALAYLEGQTLRDRLRERRAGIQESVRFGLAIAMALEEAHRHGVLHRDLKPANVFVGSDGRLRVLDFGLAKTVTPLGPLEEAPTSAAAREEARTGADSRRLPFETEPGTTTSGGTPSYMAPEQWIGSDSTTATDVWALGVILFELCSGRRPFEAADLVRLAFLVGNDDPAPALDRYADVPADLAAIVGECLAKDPAARPAASMVRETLERLLGHARPTPSEAESPFRGLLPFTERHADVFFGREQEVAALTERLRLQPLVAVVGPSGAGKSSFVHAGLVPRLREQEPWVVISMRPGAQPFAALAARMLRGETQSSPTLGSRRKAAQAAVDPIEVAEARNEEEELATALRTEAGLLAMELRNLASRRQAQVLLLVDQLEELYTLTQDDELRRAFMAAICSAADDPGDPVRVVFTVRDDFLGRLATSREAREALTQVTVLQRLGEAQLREILVRPLEALGYHYDDPTVVDHTIASVEVEPTSLPLLQFAAQRLWEKRDVERRLLLRSAYDEMGGVGGALGKHADGVLDGLSPPALKLARKMMLRLVTPERTRRVVPRARLLEALGPEIEPLLDRLVDARLVSVSRARAAHEATLELAHESLTRTWSTLSRWIDESDEEVAFINEVVQAADLWERRGRRPEELWRGDALRDAARMRQLTELPQLAREFLDAARRREATTVLRKRVAVATAIAVLVAVAVVLAFQKRELAEQTRVADERRAEALEQRAEALREGARSAIDRRQMLEARSKLRTALEIETRETTGSGEARASTAMSRALWHQLHGDPLLWTATFGAQPFGAAYAPDGQTLATSTQIGVIHLLDARTRRARVLRGHDVRIFALAFSSDGKTLASGGEDGTIRLWDVESGTIREAIAGDGEAIQEVAFSPDGKLVASGDRKNRIRLRDADSGAEVRALVGHESWVYGLAFARDGKRLVSGGKDGSVRIWDVQSGKQLHDLRGHQGWVMVVDFSPDGKHVASAGVDKAVRLWNADSGKEERVLHGHKTMLFAVSFSPDGKQLASSGHDSGIWLWSMPDGAGPRVVGASSTGASALAWSPDGTRIGAVGEDQAFRLWDTRAAAHAAVNSGHGPGVMAAVLSPDGKRIASTGLDKTVRLWDADSGVELAVLEGHTEPVFDVAFDDEGTLLASASADRSVRLWDLDAGIEKNVLSGHGSKVMSLAFRPKSEELASAGADGRILLWDVASATPVGQLGGKGAMLTDIAFRSDGARLVSSAIDGSVVVWDVDARKVVATLRRHGAPNWSVAFDPSGNRVAIGATSGTAHLLDASSGDVLQSFGPFAGRMSSVTFSPDGKRLAAGSSDADARVWDLASGEAIAFAGPTFEVNTVSYSRDGARVVTAHDDGGLRLWDAATLQPSWRAPALLRARPGDAGPELFSHLGWSRLGPGAAPEPAGQAAHGKGAHASTWRQALAERARFASEAPTGELICLQTHTGTVELWDRATDTRLGEHALPSLDQVVALPDGCAARAHGDGEQAGSAVIVDRQGTHGVVNNAEVSALAVTDEHLLVAVADELRSFDHAGAGPISARRVGSGVSAIASLPGEDGEILVLGYESGDLELWPVDPKEPRVEVSFERVPASVALSLALGPMRTVIAGFANGMVGQWSLDDGSLLEQAKLHGPAWHLLLHEQTLYAASALGQHLTWDLSVFHAESCALLRQVWAEVPVVWEGGRAVVREAPADHPCRTAP